MAEAFDFSSYLASVTRHYEKWWTLYTLTDAESQKKLEARNSALASPFDFGMLVQEVKREDPKSLEKSEAQPEKPETLPVLDGLRKYAQEHVLLVGRPGSGKSTALLRLLLEEAKAALTPSPSPKIGRGELEGVAEKGCKIPVLVELRFWQTSVVDRILGFLHRHDPNLNLDESALITLLRQGRFLLLVDGLNELPSEDAKRDVTRFRQDFPCISMVFTTRDLSVGGDFGLEKKLEMQPLKDTQMRQFVIAYLPEQGEQLLRQLKDRMRGFAETPLLLWMLCSLFQQTGKIPPNLGMVFRQFTRGFEKIKQDAPASDESRRWWSELLQYLAFVMMQGKPEENPPSPLSPPPAMVSILRSEAKDIFERFLQGRVSNPGDRAAECLDDLLEHHLIQENGEQIEFRHQLIQEHYAAEYLLRLLPNLSDEELQQDYLNYLKWTEPLKLLLQLVNNQKQVVQIVRLALNADLQLGAILSGAVKAEFQRATIRQVNGLKSSPRLNLRLLEQTQSESAIDGLIKALEDQNSSVRQSAVEALGKIPSNAVIGSLVKALEDQNSSVRWRAATALGKIPSNTVIDSLIKALEDQNSSVRRRATEALGEISSDVVIDDLIKALDDQNSAVRQSAVEALRKMPSEAAINGLLKALDDPDLSLRQRVAKTLEKMLSEAATDGLIKALDHQNPLVRQHAVEALGKMPSEAATDGLIKALDDQDSGVRWKATAALGEMPSETATDGLIKALDDQDSGVRWRATAALGKMPSETATDGLIKALDDQDPSVRWRATAALGKMPSETATDGLIKALDDQNSSVRQNAVEALGKMPSEAATGGLIKALDDQDSGVRWRATAALGKMPSKAAATDGLIKALDDQNSSVRQNAVEALGEMPSETATNSLLKALDDQDSGVRWRATAALGKMPSKAAATDGLIKALDDQNSSV
ncbi:MAG: HEAT repeat domain-containing protein, partial [Elainellaceae cyanobacterium]